MKQIGIALIAFAVISPMAYCQARTEEAKSNEKIACIQARGLWRNGWGGYCDLGVEK